MRFPFFADTYVIFRAVAVFFSSVAFLNDGPFKTRILQRFNVAVSNSAAIEPEAIEEMTTTG